MTAKKFPDPSSTLEQDIIGFLQSSRLDDVRDYIAKGRQYHALSNEEVVEHWCAAMNALGDDAFSPEKRTLHNDMEAELQLRRISPPYDRVTDALEKFISTVDTEVQKLSADPVALEERNEELQRDIDAFIAERDRPKN